MRREGLKPSRRRSRRRTSRGKSHLLLQLIVLSNRIYSLKREIHFSKRSVGLAVLMWFPWRQAVGADWHQAENWPWLAASAPDLCLFQATPEHSEKQKCYNSVLKISSSCGSGVAEGFKELNASRLPTLRPFPACPRELRAPMAGPSQLRWQCSPGQTAPLWRVKKKDMFVFIRCSGQIHVLS